MKHAASLYGGEMHLDYKLVSEGVKLTADYIAFLFDGTFNVGSPDNDEHDANTFSELPKIPAHRLGMKPFQIITSQESLQTLIEATADLGWIDASRTAPSKVVNDYLDGFEEAFGEHPDVKVQVTAEHSPNETSIQIVDDDGIASLDAGINMHIKNPFYKTDMDVAYVHVTM